MSRTIPLVLGPCAVSLVALTACGGGSPTAPTGHAEPTYSVTGTVRDADTSRTLVNAVVTVSDGALAGTAARTDPDGVYRLLLLTGAPRLQVTAAGYQSQVLQLGTLTADTTADAALHRSAATLAGVVTESAPTAHVPVPGATIRVVSGATAGQTVVAGSDGSFELTGIEAAVDLLAQAPGYEDARIHAIPGTTAPLTVRLMPVLQTMTRTVGTFPIRRPPETFTVDVHHAGIITVSKLYFYYQEGKYVGGQYISATRTIEIWTGTRLIAAGTTNEQNTFGPALSAFVEGGARYEIRILGGEWTNVTLEWPN